MSEENVIKLVKKELVDLEENPNYVEIKYIDNSTEDFDADAFGLHNDFDNYIAIWKDTPYELLALVNLNNVKTIKVLPKPIVEGEILDENGC